MTEQLTATTTLTGEDQLRRIWESLRVLIVGGIPAGALIVGLGSRVAMFVLRITSPKTLSGVKSDDGFIIGQVTLGGTYNLLQIGAAVGIVGAGAYLLVAPWLIGPTWFRRLTTGLAAAAVAGSMLVHADGIDFTVLEPTWLAIGLFVALPGLFGTLIAMSVDAVRNPGSWTNDGRRRRWLLVIISVACFPATLLLVAVAFIVLVFWAIVGEAGLPGLVRRIPAYAFVIRGVWLLVAVAGLVALISDIRSLT